MRKLILLLCTVILSLSAFAQTDKIFYTSTDGNIVDVWSDDFDANIVSNEYKDGQGIITFDGPVTSIGSYAFSYWDSLATITIPEGVTSIGEYAFLGCTSLTTITIPNTVTSIGNHAFYECSSLISIIIPEGVTSVGTEAFADCSSLTSIVVDAGNTKYDSRENCNAIIETATNTLIAGCKSTIIPNTATSIGGSAFYGCSGLTSINIPNSVTSIGGSAFHHCKGLTSIEFGDGLKLIDSRAFEGCSSLVTVIIPNNVESIGAYAFCDCHSLSSVMIGKGVTSIGGHAFYLSTNITSMVVDAGNAKYDSRDNCNAIIETATNTLVVGCKRTIIPNSVTRIGNDALPFCPITSITVPNSVTSIGKDAFYGCENLSSVSLGNSLQIIEDGAFGNCYSLTSIVIPNSVTTIGTFSFAGCDLCSVVIGEAVTSIGNYAFENTSLLSITIPKGVTSIESGTFYNCSSLASITLPNDLKTIGGLAFMGCSSLTSITIPEGVTSIENSAFRNCSKLDTVYVEATTPPTLGSTAFTHSHVCIIPCGTKSAYEASDWAAKAKEFVEDCIDPTWQIFYTSTDGTIVTPYKTDVFGANIISNEYKDGQGIITFDGPVKSVGNQAFYNHSSLASITIPDSVTSIGSYAFCNCKSLPTITIPEGVTSIEDYTFYGCSSLASITIPNSVTSIGDYAFYDCSYLTAIIIPDEATSIGEWAFSGCSSLTAITIPEGVTSIGISFSGCSSLTDIVVDARNTKYDSRDNCNAIIVTATNTLIAGCKSTIIPNTVTSIDDFAFYDCSSLTTITIPEGVTSIGVAAFEYCSKLDTVYVDATTPPTIGSSAFNSSPVCIIPCGIKAVYESSDWARYVKEFIVEQFEIAVHSNNDTWGTVTIEVPIPSPGIGTFSVSATKQVTFSPGNLQYHPADDVWRFAPNQTDYIGSANSKISSTYNGWIDLFGWGTGDEPAKSSTSHSDYQTFVDWGTNKIGNDAPNTWRTLTNSEWKYLLNNRPNASSLRGVAQVNGVNGLIFLPDNWSCPAGVTFKSGVHSSFGLKYYAAYQTFTADQWSKLEKSGAIFLPAAGLRSSTNVFDVQLRSFYWSATEYSNSNSARYLLFSSYEASMNYNNRYDGQSVRLVKDLM